MHKSLKAAALVLSFCLMGAGCSSQAGTTDQTTEQQSQYQNSEEVLNAIVNDINPNSMPSLIGGYMIDEPVQDQAGALDLSQDLADLSSGLSIPQNIFEESDSASSIMSAMNANQITAVCVQLKDAADAKAASEEFAQFVQEKHWMCGTPEVYIAFQDGNFLIMAYGFGDIVDSFEGALKTALPQASQLVRGTIAA